MKIGNDVQLVSTESEGDFNTIEAGISKDDQGYLFEVLSKRLYSNPEGTIVREITSNCFDSHVEAEIEKPVIIKFTYDEQTSFISFIDYGVGLSPDRINKVYMNYFSSTKRQTNSQIGGFGLGSKSPLAYTNTFFIITQYKGSKRTYLMSQANMKPTLDLLLEEECPIDENGTEIKIPLKNHEDAERFSKEIHDQLFYFDNVFVHDERSLKYTKIDVDELNNYKIYNFKTFKYRPQANNKKYLHLTLDKVTYPVDFTQLGMSEIEIPVAIKFDIGELEVTPSRESILYTDNSVALIKERILKFFDEIQEIYQLNLVKNDFLQYVKSIGMYFDNKSIVMKLSSTEDTLSISLNKLSNIAISGVELFSSKQLKTCFPTPQYEKFQIADFNINFNIFANLEWYKNISQGKIEDSYSRTASTSIDALIRYDQNKIFLFDTVSDRIKNRFLNTGYLLKINSFADFYKKYSKLNGKTDYKTIDLSVENKVNKIKRLYNLFIQEVCNNTGGLYSKIQLSDEFKEILEKERISRREEFKDKIKIEYCYNSYMTEEKVIESWFKNYNLIVYSERQPDTNDSELIRCYSLFNRRLSLTQKRKKNKNSNFKYTFITSAKRNIEAFIQHMPNAIHISEFQKKMDKWKTDFYLSTFIKRSNIIDKMSRTPNCIKGVNDNIYNDIVTLKKFKENTFDLDIPTEQRDAIIKSFEHHPIYITFKRIEKYFSDLKMLKYVDTYNMDNDDFKTTLKDYLKLNGKKLNPEYYIIFKDYELAMIQEAKDRKFYKEEIASMASLNNRFNYNSIINTPTSYMSYPVSFQVTGTTGTIITTIV